ncbi:MAG: hypothetical protein LUD81_04800 [Clostridiales bacterium]|nr:hypothetical protein [Clostridiales bacterium]
MALNFENEVDKWQNEGTEPSDELKESGFTAGYKPPAGVFNWFWNKMTACVSEIQSLLSTHLGKLTQADYEDDEGNRYTDVSDLHIRTDTSIYTSSGIKVVDCDPCEDGKNITEEAINPHILGQITQDGQGTFMGLSVTKGAQIHGGIQSDGDIYMEQGSSITVLGETDHIRTLHTKMTSQALGFDSSNGAYR